MRATFLASLLVFAAPAWSQAPVPAPRVPAQAACADCAVVRSVRPVTRELKPAPGTEAKPSGMVATVPLGGGEKGKVGSSTALGRESRPTDTRWEVTVRYDDGRLRVLTLGEPPQVKEGDKVRIDKDGKVSLRTD